MIDCMLPESRCSWDAMESRRLPGSPDGPKRSSKSISKKFWRTTTPKKSGRSAVHTEGRERKGRQLVAIEDKPPRPRADWRYSTGSLFIRIAAAATTIFAIALAQVQAQPATDPGAGNIKFYIGLSQGGLNDDNENDLRAFAVIQDHVKSIQRQLD